ncbi:DUF2155 domain-containing protein [Actibacterium sp. 188UL27-1]|uniref:DUF2155 domain-containing protein n=1 Tax=Actibacterium sp. 188UL27-1 TaxID=2786961 RepID=UPI00195A841E|nr:DUF2155 domain-containing protein [Actibacterium sp. 188UL27-1]MBM7068308.1 DUF2155 domain-containing protein [Actibacterium sp. 188UL27-1]
MRATVGIMTAFLATAAAAQEVTSVESATLRGLDKIDGALSDIEITRGETKSLGRLQISLEDCRYPTGDPQANAYAYLTIVDRYDPELAFDGWMIASSPALNALDHPRYDVWVLRCNTS